MSVWPAARAAGAALTRTVTGAILAPHETQRRVVSGKTGTHSSGSPGKSKCGPIDYGRRNGYPVFLYVLFKLSNQFVNETLLCEQRNDIVTKARRRIDCRNNNSRFRFVDYYNGFAVSDVDVTNV